VEHDSWPYTITIRGRDPYTFHSNNTQICMPLLCHAGERITARDFNIFQNNEHTVHVTVYHDYVDICGYDCVHLFCNLLLLWTSISHLDGNICFTQIACLLWIICEVLCLNLEPGTTDNLPNWNLFSSFLILWDSL
jgi:hypothetical protein